MPRGAPKGGWFWVGLCGILWGVPAHADVLQVFVFAADPPGEPIDPPPASLGQVALTTLPVGAEPRERCQAYCVWFERPAAGGPCEMRLYRAGDGTARSRQVDFVQDGRDAAGVAANLRRILLISTSLFAEAHFEVPVELPEAAAPRLRTPPPEVSVPAASVPASRWIEAILLAGPTFLGTDFSFNTFQAGAQLRLLGRLWAGMELGYLAPSGFDVQGERVEVGAFLLQLSAGVRLLQTEALRLAASAGPLVAFYRIRRASGETREAAHLYGRLGGSCWVHLIGPLSAGLRVDLGFSAAQVNLELDGGTRRKALQNPFVDALAGLDVSF
jgi:hypothetical protein